MVRQLFVFFGICLVVIATTLPSAAQTATSWGDPDLQGIWTFRTVTPLQRPPELANKPTLTEEEAAAYQQAEVRRQNRDLIDSKEGGLNYAPESEGGVVPYNEFWYDRGTTVVASRRTSLIIDPPDGRLPAFAPEGERRAEEQREIGRQEQRGHPVANGPEDRGVGDRCLLGFNAGPPMLPGGYNQNVQIFQTPNHVVIYNEMIHNARIIPLDGISHHSLRQWSGDSRGRWDGDTLVVDTINFLDETSLNGSSPAMHLVERFTRINGEMVNYEVTVDNPETWTRPWTAEVPLMLLDDQVPRMYEYACHEGNYSLATILRGARLEEIAAAGVAQQR
jgi:hypothetical protein